MGLPLTDKAGPTPCPRGGRKVWPTSAKEALPLGQQAQQLGDEKAETQ